MIMELSKNLYLKPYKTIENRALMAKVDKIGLNGIYVHLRKSLAFDLAWFKTHTLKSCLVVVWSRFQQKQLITSTWFSSL